MLPVDLGGKVFPVSGGCRWPSARAARQAYRLLELKRFSEFLGQPIVLQPKFFPVNADDAAKLIIAVDMHDGSEAAMRIAGRILRGVGWTSATSPTRATWRRCSKPKACRRSASTPSMSRAVHQRYEQDS